VPKGKMSFEDVVVPKGKMCFEYVSNNLLNEEMRKKCMGQQMKNM
jgi:hypothetical protein